jgi:hypothetical protein
MKKQLLERVSPHDMRNETHAEFHDEARIIVKRHGPGALGTTAQFNDEYEPAVDAELNTLDMVTYSPYTPQIKGADHDRDDTLTGFTGVVRALTHHPDPAIRAAAAEILKKIRHYGNLKGKGYEKESAAINDLLRDLDTLAGKALVAAAGVGEWVERLRAANKKFVDLELARDTELGQRPGQRMKELRVVTDAALTALLDRIDAMITLNGITYTAALAPFVADWNALATRYKHRLAVERGRRNAKNEEENDEL